VLSQSTAEYRDGSSLTTRIDLHRCFSTNAYGWHRWVFDQLDLPPRCRILELGCGTGALWRENLERIPAGWDITLTDASPGMVEEAKSRLLSGEAKSRLQSRDRQSHLHGQRTFTFDVIDATCTPWSLPEASFDAVLANHMLYYVPDKPTAFAEIRRVLKPGGRFFASTVGRRHLAEITVMLQELDPALASWGNATASFELENGMAQLAGWFSDITVRRYQDSLRVTQVEPLVQYILSAWPQRDAALESRLRAHVGRQMESHGGELCIQKDSGMFLCVSA